MNRKILLFLGIFIFLTSTPALALDLKATPAGKLIKQIAPFIKLARFRGNIEVVGATYLTVDGKKINFDTNTKLFRKFGGKATISEFSVGDGIQVVGKWTSEDKTEVNASIIRNFSVQKRHAVFIGTIKSLNPKTATLVLTTSHRGDQNVMPTEDTKYVTRKMEASSFDKLGVSDKIRVKGAWDSKLNQIFEVTQIKDYSL